MCAIVDANAAHEVFGSNQQPTTSEVGEGFFQWLSRGKGKLVVGGEKLEKELDRVPKFRMWAIQAQLSGRLINKGKDRINQEAKKGTYAAQCRNSANPPWTLGFGNMKQALRLSFSGTRYASHSSKRPSRL